MFENVINFFKKIGKKDQIEEKSKDTAKERLHLVLMQDRANVSADFLDMMRQEIIEVIKKYIDVDEKDIDVRLTNKTNEDGTMGAPALYANIPITGIKEEMKKEKEKETKDKKQEEKAQEVKEEIEEIEENNNCTEESEEKGNIIEKNEENQDNEIVDTEKQEIVEETVQEIEQEPEEKVEKKIIEENKEKIEANKKKVNNKKKKSNEK